MKRRVLACVLAVTAAAGALTGCGSKETGKAEGKDLVVWAGSGGRGRYDSSMCR